MGLFDKPKRRKTADRRAGKGPYVGSGKLPRTRNADGTWRRKNPTAGKKRPKKNLLKKLLG